MTAMGNQRRIVCPQCNYEIETQKFRIEKPKFLIVEGKDDECFFCAFIEYLGLSDIQVAGIGGKDKIKGNLKALIREPNFPQVVSLGVVRDADLNPKDAFISVRNALLAAGLSSPKKPLSTVKGPPKVSIMIIPSPTQNGSLEDLCLEAVANDPAQICANQYFDCLRSQNIDPPKELSKARVRVFLSSREDPTLLLGISAQKGYWPFDNKAFASIRKFVQSL